MSLSSIEFPAVHRSSVRSFLHPMTTGLYSIRKHREVAEHQIDSWAVAIAIIGAKKGVRRSFGPRDSRRFSARRFDNCGFHACTRLHSGHTFLHHLPFRHCKRAFYFRPYIILNFIAASGFFFLSSMRVLHSLVGGPFILN